MIFEADDRMQVPKVVHRFRSTWCTFYQVTKLASIHSLINNEKIHDKGINHLYNDAMIEFSNIQAI